MILPVRAGAEAEGLIVVVAGAEAEECTEWPIYLNSSTVQEEEPEVLLEETEEESLPFMATS